MMWREEGRMGPEGGQGGGIIKLIQCIKSLFPFSVSENSEK